MKQVDAVVIENNIAIVYIEFEGYDENDALYSMKHEVSKFMTALYSDMVVISSKKRMHFMRHFIHTMSSNKLL